MSGHEWAEHERADVPERDHSGGQQTGEFSPLFAVRSCPNVKQQGELGAKMLDEGFNPYVADANASVTHLIHRPRNVSASPVSTPAPRRSGASIKAPTTPAGIRDFDFAAALFNDPNAWRELARTIASDAA
jgi:hypothetical protein